MLLPEIKMTGSFDAERVIATNGAEVNDDKYQLPIVGIGYTHQYHPYDTHRTKWYSTEPACCTYCQDAQSACRVQATSIYTSAMVPIQALALKI